MDKLFEEIKKTVIAGQHKEIEALVQEAIQNERNLDDLINEALIAAMDVVGDRFARSEIFVPEMLVSAVTMKKGLDIIKPLLKEDKEQAKGKIVLCTVKGDLHDIGKNLVGMMFEGAGFEVVDVGIDQEPQAFVDALKAHKASLFGMSALLTTTMPKMGETILGRSFALGPGGKGSNQAVAAARAGGDVGFRDTEAFHFILRDVDTVAFGQVLLDVLEKVDQLQGAADGIGVADVAGIRGAVQHQQ